MSRGARNGPRVLGGRGAKRYREAGGADAIIVWREVLIARPLGDAPSTMATVLAAVGAALPEYGWTDLQVQSGLGGGVGLPIPEDLTLVAGGALAHRGVLPLLDVILVGIIAVVCADWIVYLAGRRYGRGIVKLPLLARHFGAARLDTVRSAVERHGMRAVFAARFVFGFRMATFLGAGTFGVPPYRFGIAEAAGTVVFVPAMVTLGFLFSDRAEHIVHDATRLQHWIVLIGLVALAGYLGLRAWSSRAGLGGGTQ